MHSTLTHLFMLILGFMLYIALVKHFHISVEGGNEDAVWRDTSDNTNLKLNPQNLPPHKHTIWEYGNHNMITCLLGLLAFVLAGRTFRFSQMPLGLGQPQP